METNFFKSQNVFVKDLRKDLGIVMASNKEALIATNSKVHAIEASQLVVYVPALLPRRRSYLGVLTFDKKVACLCFGAWARCRCRVAAACRWMRCCWNVACYCRLPL